MNRGIFDENSAYKSTRTRNCSKRSVVSKKSARNYSARKKGVKRKKKKRMSFRDDGGAQDKKIGRMRKLLSEKMLVILD